MSTELRRSLGLGDLVLAYILVIVGLSSLGPAARLGAMHWAYWLAGVALFQVPLAIVVRHLTRAMPGEGGPYQWARAAFGDFAGFMVAWNFWHFMVVFLSLLGMTVGGAIGYATGAGEALMSNRLWLAGVSAMVTLALMALAIAGLGAAKWVHNVASVTLLVAVAVLIALPLFSSSVRMQPEVQPLSLMQVVLFTRIAVFALAGLECMAILVDECRGGARDVTRSIAIAVPCIAAIYILGTHSVLTFVAPQDVDQINPVAQAFSIALRPFGAVAGIAVTFAVMLLVVREFAQSSQAFAAMTRMPLVAGWDHLVPRWFTRLQPRTRTPVNAILAAGAATFTCSFAAILFAGRQEAFQILLNTAGVLFAITYIVMFIIPLRTPAPPLVRTAAVSGLAVTTAFLILTFVPIIPVPSPARYAIAIGVVVAVVNGVGASVVRAFR